MVLLEHGLRVAHLTGMLPTLNKGNPGYLLLIFFNCVCLVSMVLHSGYFFLNNYKNDFAQATNALSLCILVFMHAVKIAIGLLNNDKLIALYRRLKKVYDNPQEYRICIRDRVDERIKFYMVKLIRFTFVAAWAIILTPVLSMAIEYLDTGAIQFSRWDLPIPYGSPFYNTRSSPTYEILYVSIALSFTQCAFMAYTAVFLFIGISLHINGLFMELKCRLDDTLKVIRAKDIKDNLIFSHHYKKCIDFHNEILELVKDVETVFGPVFFVQFMNTIITVCVHSYLVTQVSVKMLIYCSSFINKLISQNSSNGRIMSNITYTTFGSGELIIFAFCGSLITKGNELCLTALNDHPWYEMSPQTRKDFKFIIARSQRMAKVTFLHWIECSASSLQFVFTASFNMFTMLQHIARRKHL